MGLFTRLSKSTANCKQYPFFNNNIFTRYRIYFDCGILGEIEKECFVKITKCKGNSYNLHAEGTRSDIEDVKALLQNGLKVRISLKRFYYEENINTGTSKLLKHH